MKTNRERRRRVALCVSVLCLGLLLLAPLSATQNAVDPAKKDGGEDIEKLAQARALAQAKATTKQADK
jgi:hypothetical protein